MKTIINKIWIAFVIVAVALILVPTENYAQETKSQALDKNISIYAEDEPLSDVIEKICKYLDLDYSYNSTIVGDKKISLNISNKPIKYVLDKLMKDFYLLFEIEDNILVVRDFVPLESSMEYQQSVRQFNANNRGFLFNNPRKKRLTLDFKSASNLIIIPVTINDSDTLNFIL